MSCIRKQPHRVPYKSRYRFDYYKQQIQHNSHYINCSHVLGINMVVVVMMVMVVAFTVMGMFLARMLPAFNIVLIMKMMHNYYFLNCLCKNTTFHPTRQSLILTIFLTPAPAFS